VLVRVRDRAEWPAGDFAKYKPFHSCELTVNNNCSLNHVIVPRDSQDTFLSSYVKYRYIVEDLDCNEN